MFKLRSFLLGGAALAAMTGVAVAADVPMRNPVFTKAAPAWSWEGQYIGVHGGYFDGSLDLGPGAGINLSPSKGFGGVQFGYLHHLSRNWLIGYEVDASFGVKGSEGGIAYTVDAFGTARTRLGYAQGPWLFYGTAGLAWAKIDYVGLNSADRPQVGYAVGAGVEYALARNWSAKFEYLYMDLGTTVSTGLLPLTTDVTASTVRLGLNYRFANWAAAPVSDMPVKAPVRVSGWTGPYIGIHGMYGTGDFDATGGAAAATSPKGGMFGIQSGYNWQLSRNWVFGLEGDSSWGSISNANATGSADIDAMGTVRARFGYADGNVLYYGTGGLAWLHANTVAGAGAVTRDQYWLGWTAGAGVEYAFAPRWSAKLEYLYSDYGLTDVNVGANFNEDFKVHTVKLGLNYRAGLLDFISGRW